VSGLAARIGSLTPEQRQLLHLRLRKKNPTLLKLQPIPRRAGAGPWPLTYEQERLWLVQELYPFCAAFNVNSDTHFRGPLDVAALLAALGEVVRRHEILRTLFVARGGIPFQSVRPAATPALPLVDLSALPEDLRRAEQRRRELRHARQPFDLAMDGPLRLALLRLAPGHHVLLVTLHHIATDWWSSNVFQNELASLYRSLTRGHRPALPEPTIQYADFAVWQRSWLPREIAARGLLTYWRERLAGAPGEIDLPRDRPRPPVSTFEGARLPFLLVPETADSLRALARNQEVTLFILILAVYAALLTRIAGQDDILVGTPVADRSRPETEHLIGYFLNNLVLRVGVAAGSSFQGLLAHTRSLVHEAYDHQELPFGLLLDEIKPQRSLNRAPLFQVAFVFVMIPAPRTPEEAAEEGVFDPGTSRVDLTLVAEDMPQGGIRAFWEYSTEIFDRTTLARLAGHFQNLLAGIVADPAARISELTMLSAAERDALLLEWNDTQAPFPETTLLHQFFEAAVERSAESIAAVCAGRELTYAGLEARANRLAHLLRTAEVGRGVAVGVWVERSLDMLTAVLGVLKAGGYYVALDSAWPAGRVESILARTGAPAIVVGGARLAAVEKMRWRLPALTDIVCIAIAEPEPPVEALEPEIERELWDYVAERAVDRVTAGGFVSAFTGLPFSEAAVDEYRDRVLSLAAPWLQPEARVLEIGNGSGLLLWELASRVAHVTGVDPSPLTQERNRERAEREGRGNVELLTGFAHEIDDLLDTHERFDLVLLASTVQFFPGPRYLERVVRRALDRLSAGGALLIADVLDARSREALLQAIEQHRAPAGIAGAGVTRRPELYLDEDFFRDLGAALPAAAEISIHHRSEGFPNELRFRYDVLLRRSQDGAAPTQTRRKRLWTGWHLDRSPAGRLPAVATPDDIAYVIHTSGSTGEPKGIVVQHRPAANLVDWVNRTFEIGPEDRGLFVTSLAFDLSVYDIFGVLAAGGAIQVATDEELGDPDRLLRWLREGGVTLWNSAPAALVRLAPLFPAEPNAASRVRRVLLSGDWIPVTLPDRVRQAFPGAEVTALGGATEATVWSNAYPVGEVDPRWPSIPYGRPISNARYHVLDAGTSPCPIGVPGDLYIGGDCLGTGYARRPDLTALAFSPDPFSGRLGARLYRTGDRARYRADGNLEFLGRLDRQVKVRGYRIELGEIEVALARLPGVHEAVVLAREDEPGDQRLVAYVVPAAGASSSALCDTEWREALRRELPEYMMPSAFVVLAALPVTASGKLDRRNLPAPQWSVATVSEAPRTPVEEVLAAIWSHVLGVPRVGREDGFFALGGHSLSAMQVISRVRQTFGVELELAALFKAPTLATLAEQIDEAVGQPQQPPIEPQPRQGLLPLSFAQERLWFLAQLDAASAAYNIPNALRLQGPLDVPMLARTLDEIVRRHEVLRTTFAEVDGEPVQVVHPPASCPLPMIDLCALAAPLRQAEVDRRVASEATRPFDLAAGPLLRTSLLRLGEEEHVALLTMHHIVSDGWSMRLLVDEVTGLYRSFLAGEPSPLPELPVQYADYALWQRRVLEPAALEREKAFWRQRLAGMRSGIDLPTDRPRPPRPTYSGDSVPLDVPGDLAARLAAFSRTEGVTLFMTVLAAFQMLLRFHAPCDEMALGAVVANRDHLSTEGMIGLFINQLVLRTDLSGDPTFRELLARVRRVVLEGYAHRNLPFEKVVEAVNPDRAADRAPLFQVRVAFNNVPSSRLELPGLSLSSLEPGVSTVQLDLVFSLAASGDSLRGILEFRTELFDRRRIERMLDQYGAILQTVVERPDLRLSEIERTLAERQRAERAERDSAAEEAALRRLKGLRRQAPAW
jgi:amino acid adenylation domain-containing protein